MSAAAVSNNDSRFMSIRMIRSRHSSLFVVVVITSTGDFKLQGICKLLMGLIALKRDGPTTTCPRGRGLAAMVRKVMADTQTRYEKPWLAATAGCLW